MYRREFLGAAGAALVPSLIGRPLWAADLAGKPRAACCGPKYASPREAMASEPEKLLYVTALPAGRGSSRPDYLATVDVDRNSSSYGQVLHRLPMPGVGDELHHFGWNACSGCHAEEELSRRYLIVPGLRSGRIHVIDAADPRALKLHKVIEAREIAEKTNLSAPHTVHCLPDGQVMLSMLGDGSGNAPGGFLLLNQKFEIAGRWDAQPTPLRFNYDFWYQPSHNVMVSSEWASPKTFGPGFKLDDVKAGKYGSRLYFWDWTKRELIHTADLGEHGMIPLEVRFHHNPTSTHGFVGAALSSVIWHWYRDEQPFDSQSKGWHVDKVVEVPPVEVAGWPFPVPGLITDQLLSMDDRWLYFSNWLHGDIRRYDISNPAQPKLAAQLWCGGVLGKKAQVGGHELAGGPQMLQLSFDGRRLYVTNSLFSSWDDEFYPRMAETGSYLVQVDCDPDGSMRFHDDFYVDFGREPGGPARAHEMRFPEGDCTSEIWT
jgi:methanethiol oxidase